MQAFEAVESGDLKEVDSLLQAGVDIRFIDETGNTVLHVAAKALRPVTEVDALLTRGTDVSRRNAQGQTPLDVAFEAHQIQWHTADTLRLQVLGESDPSALLALAITLGLQLDSSDSIKDTLLKRARQMAKKPRAILAGYTWRMKQHGAPRPEWLPEDVWISVDQDFPVSPLYMTDCEPIAACHFCGGSRAKQQTDIHRYFQRDGAVASVRLPRCRRCQAAEANAYLPAILAFCWRRS